MTFTFTTNNTTTSETSGTTTTTTTQNFDSQLSILTDKGFNQKPLNLRLLSKFEGDVEKVEKRLIQTQKNQSSLRERILNQYQSSLDQLSQKGFSDHPRLPALLKKFDGDVDQIISFIERSSPKAKNDKVHPKKDKIHPTSKGLKNKEQSSSSPSDLEVSPPSASEPSSIEETSSSSSSTSSDPTPTPSTLEITSTTSEPPVADQSPKSSNDKAEREAKKQALKQQIRELQSQMKEINAHNLVQKQEKERKKKERQEKLILREAKILKNLSDLKLKSSKTNDMIQRQEDQLVKIRSFLSVQA